MKGGKELKTFNKNMDIKNLKTEIFGKYKIETFEKDGKILVKVFNLNAKVIWNSQIYYYSFRSVEDRQEWISNFKANVESYEKRKLERKLARKNVVNTFKVGEILVNSWGYDQTNIDFYQVVAVRGKMVDVREICGKMDDYESHGMAAYKTAVKDAFVKDAPVISKRVTSNDYLNFNSYSSLSRWDGRAMYCSWYA